MDSCSLGIGCGGAGCGRADMGGGAAKLEAQAEGLPSQRSYACVLHLARTKFVRPT